MMQTVLACLLSAAFGAAAVLIITRPPRHCSEIYRQETILHKALPGWRRIVGWGPDGNVDHNAPYRKWLATQSPEYQHKLNTTISAEEIIRSIRAFQAQSNIRRVG